MINGIALSGCTMRLAFAAPTPAGYGAYIKVVQCNIEDGGQFTEGRAAGAVTWDTATRFARLMSSDALADTAVIGMEEIAAGDDRVQSILITQTRRFWEVQHYEQGIGGHGSGLAIFWRPDLVTLEKDFGTGDVGQIDNGYLIRFGGALFTENHSGRRFGFFTGKLVWEGAIFRGVAVPESERVREAGQLLAWVNGQMGAFPGASRVLAMDMNSTYESDTWKTLNEEFYDGHSSLATFDSHYHLIFGHRLDYLWWSPGQGLRAEDGFRDGPRRSEHFGSDHRFVWGEVAI